MRYRQMTKALTEPNQRQLWKLIVMTKVYWWRHHHPMEIALYRRIERYKRREWVLMSCLGFKRGTITVNKGSRRVTNHMGLHLSQKLLPISQKIDPSLSTSQVWAGVLRALRLWLIVKYQASRQPSKMCLSLKARSPWSLSWKLKSRQGSRSLANRSKRKG